MGLEDGKRGPGDKPVDQKPTSILGNLHKGLLSKGWNNTDFAFSLARQTGAIDITKGERRVLYYTASKEDYETYNLLSQNRLPVFPVVMSPLAEGISSIELPQTSKALDSMKFPDQVQQGGFMGSFEIMDSLAYLLARIYRRTGKIPDDLRLGKLALIPGDRDNIRLIPPLKLVDAKDWEVLAAKLLEDLNAQDPHYDHTKQIKYFKDVFEQTLRDEKR